MIVTVTLNPAIDKALEVPGFRIGEHARARVRGLLPAGKGVNVARGLARLGGRAVAAGLVGRNEQAIYAESLAEDGVEARFCPVAGRTRTNTTILDPEARTTTHLREEGFEVGAEELSALSESLVKLLGEGDAGAAVFAGSLPPGISPQDFADLLRACRAAGAPLVVDTNGPALRAALQSGAVETIKPNLAELGQCLGRLVARDEAQDAAAQLLDRVRTVLLTLGQEGALLVRADGTVGRRCPLGQGELRNTVGCGDAFLAGWLRGCELTDEPQEALCWAAAAGAASARSESTVGYGLRDVRELLPRCAPLC